MLTRRNISLQATCERPCKEAVCPDTLTFRNGKSVTGNWLGAELDKVQFLSDDKLQTYLKADLLAVTFGIGVTATAAAPVTARPVNVQPPQTVYGPEPEWVGAVFFRDEAGKFIPLERAAATYLPKGVGIGYSPNRLYRTL